jgi:hypothetical protein
VLLPKLFVSDGSSRGKSEDEGEGESRFVEVVCGSGCSKSRSSGSGVVEVGPAEPPADAVSPLCSGLEETIGSIDWLMRCVRQL